VADDCTRYVQFSDADDPHDRVTEISILIEVAMLIWTLSNI